MSTIFPGSASVGQVYNGYTFDGTAWNINGIDLTENYLEESSASATYLTQVNASNTYTTQTSASTTYLPLSAASANQIIYKNSSNVATGSSGLIYDGTGIKVNGNLESLNSNGDEGGEIFLKKAATNTTLSDGVTIDINQNKLRIFETTGNNRGASLDISSLGNGVGSQIAIPGVNGIPLKMATGYVNTTGNNPATITFPAGRFSAAPTVSTTCISGAAAFASYYSVSSTGFTMATWDAAGSLWAREATWIAVQM